MAPMNRLTVVVLFILGGCAHRAHVTGAQSNPSARVESATFSHVADEVIVQVAVALEGSGNRDRAQILVRTQIPCRVGPVPPPDGFRIVYVTFSPTTFSPMSVKEGFVTVHQCQGSVLELSGGWFVEGTVATALEMPFQPPNPVIPVTHVELTRVTATEVPPTGDLR
jgi:hypothetical protein